MKKQPPQRTINAAYKSSQSMTEPLPEDVDLTTTSSNYDNFKPDGDTLLRENGIIRGYCKGQMVEAVANVAAVEVKDTRNYSNEPYTPYPSQDQAFPRPNVTPVKTPPDSYTKD